MWWLVHATVIKYLIGRYGYRVSSQWTTGWKAMKVTFINYTSQQKKPIFDFRGIYLNMSVFYVTWRKAIRKVFRLPYRTHCDLLPVIAECSHIETQLLCRLVKFVNGAISSHNVQLNLLMNIAINGSLSHMSDNINHMLSKAKITRHMVTSYNINNLLDIVNKNVNIPSENSVKIGAFVRTVVFDRDYASFLSIEELDSILNIICTE